MVREGRVPARRPPPQVCPPRQVCTFHGGQPTPSPPATPTPSLLNLPDQVPALPESTPTGVSTLRSHPRGVALARCPVHDAAVLVLSCGPRNPVLPGMVPGSGLLGTHGGGLGGAGAPPPHPHPACPTRGHARAPSLRAKALRCPQPHPHPPCPTRSHPRAPSPRETALPNPPTPQPDPAWGSVLRGTSPKPVAPRVTEAPARAKTHTGARVSFLGFYCLDTRVSRAPRGDFEALGPRPQPAPGRRSGEQARLGRAGPSGRVAWGGR